MVWFVLGFFFWLTAFIAPGIVRFTGLTLIFLITCLTLATPSGSRTHGGLIAVAGWLIGIVPAAIAFNS